MTHHTRAALTEHRSHRAPAPQPLDLSRPIRRASLVAGASLLLMSVLAGFGALFAVDGLVTEGDGATTAADVLASEGLFRSGVAALYVVIVLDVVVAWALFRVFSPVSVAISRLAAWSRLAYAAVYLIALSQLVGIPDLLRSDAYAGAFTPEQQQAQALLRFDAYTDIWMAGLVLFGVHLALVGYLAYRSGYVPRLLGVLLVVAGAGYVLDTFVNVLSQDTPATVSRFTFLGELLLALWLVVRGRRISLEVVDHAI